MAPRAVAIAASAAALLALTAALYAGYTSRIGAAVDFFLPWWSLRQALLHHLSPYDPALGVAARAARFYGQPPPLPQYPYRFSYPLYFAFFVAPLLPLPYPWAAAAWMVVQLTCTAAAALALCRLLDWPRTGAGRLVVASLATLSYPGFLSVLLGQITPLALLLMVWSQLSVARNRPALAGALLALSTVKPQIVWLAGPLLVLDLLRRSPAAGRQMLLSTLGTLAVLCTVTMVWIPAWPVQFVASLRGYGTDEPTPSALLLLARWALERRLAGEWSGPPAAVAVALGGAIVAASVYWWWRAHPTPAHLLAMALAVTVVVTPLRALTAQLALVVPAVWVGWRLAGRGRTPALAGGTALSGGGWALVLLGRDAPFLFPQQVIPPLVVFALMLAFTLLARSESRAAGAASFAPPSPPLPG